MNKQERWETILHACHEKNDVYVDEFVDLTHCSIATVRRDLQEMEDLHMIVRFHGGARINQERKDELPMVYKSESHAMEKNHIARLAAHQIKDNQVVFLDAGSSTFEMLKYIHAKNITVVTIGIPHLQELNRRDIRTIVLGGSIRSSTQAITGIQTLAQLDDMYFDVAFLGTNGLDKHIGATTSNKDEAAVKQKAAQHAKSTYLLADSSKFNKISAIKFLDINDCTIIGKRPDDYSEFDNFLYMKM